MCLHEITERHEIGSDFYNEIRTGYGAFIYDPAANTLTTDTMGRNITLDTWMECHQRVAYQEVSYNHKTGKFLSGTARKYRAGFHKFAQRKHSRQYAGVEFDCGRYHCYTNDLKVVLPVQLWGVQTVGKQYYGEATHSGELYGKCFVADQMLVDSAALRRVVAKWWKDVGCNDPDFEHSKPAILR